MVQQPYGFRGVIAPASLKADMLPARGGANRWVSGALLPRPH